MRRLFIRSAGGLLLVTALAKLVSALGTAQILQSADPIFQMSFRHVFWIAGAIELAVALVCLLGRNILLQSALLAWLATDFFLYRLGLVLTDYHRPCPCLGNLTDALHISPGIADNSMKVALAYIVIGSYLTLFYSWHRRPGAAPATALAAGARAAFETDSFHR